MLRLSQVDSLNHVVQDILVLRNEITRIQDEKDLYEMARIDIEGHLCKTSIQNNRAQIIVWLQNNGMQNAQISEPIILQGKYYQVEKVVLSFEESLEKSAHLIEQMQQLVLCLVLWKMESESNKTLVNFLQMQVRNQNETFQALAPNTKSLPNASLFVEEISE